MSAIIDASEFPLTNQSANLTSDQQTYITNLVATCITEDVYTGDITTQATIPPTTQSSAVFIAKANGVISGIAIAEYIFICIDKTLKIHWSITDGTHVTKSQQFGFVTGKAASLLVAERLVLNVMQRMSGIATNAARFVAALQSVNSTSTIIDTRKTVPGLRLLDKLAVTHGGAQNHRIGLYDMFMIKDNHISAAGGIEQALSAVSKYIQQHSLPASVHVEIEVRTEDELQQVLLVAEQYTVHRIMLDNMVKVQYKDGNTDNLQPSNLTIDTTRLCNAVKLINNKYESEASGNVNIGTVAEIGKSGVTFISVGALTHSVTAFDISLKILENDGQLFNGHTQGLTAHSAA